MLLGVAGVACGNAIYAIQAYLDDILVVSGVLLSHTPSQVYVNESKLAPLAPILQLRRVTPFAEAESKRVADILPLSSFSD